jgi:hypothetical protein
MFLQSYSERGGSRDVTGLAALSLMPVLRIYLTDFLNRTFSRENAKNHPFCGGEKMKTAAVYHAVIN